MAVKPLKSLKPSIKRKQAERQGSKGPGWQGRPLAKQLLFMEKGFGLTDSGGRIISGSCPSHIPWLPDMTQGFMSLWGTILRTQLYRDRNQAAVTRLQQPDVLSFPTTGGPFCQRPISVSTANEWVALPEKRTHRKSFSVQKFKEKKVSK